MRHRLALISALAFALAVLGTSAHADSRFIVHVHASRGRLDARLSAELAALGLTVTELEPLDARADLEQIARAAGATAAVRAVEEDYSIEVWAEARSDNEAPIHERVQIAPSRGWNLNAVSALEVLRARTLGVEAVPDALPSGPIAQTPAPRLLTNAAPRAPWLWVHLGLGTESSPGGLGPTASILGEVRFDLPTWMGISAFGLVNPVATQVARPEGVANVKHEIFGAAIEPRVGLLGVDASAGMGMAVALFSMNGQPLAPGYRGQDASIATLAPVLRLAAAAHVAEGLRLRLGLTGGFASPQAVIRFAGQEVASWGRPFGWVTLGLEWGALK